MRYLLVGLAGRETVARNLVLGLILSGLGAIPQSARAQASEEEDGARAEGRPPEALVETASAPSRTPPREVHDLSFWHDEALKIALFSSSGFSLSTEEMGLSARRARIEEMDPRVRRARAGLLGMTGVFFLGGLVAIIGAAVEVSEFDLADPSAQSTSDAPIWAGVALMAGGFVGMITSGGVLRARKKKLRLREAHHGGPRRVQWDPEASRIAF